MKALVYFYADKYHVSGDDMWAVVQCEDPTLDPKQQSFAYSKGIREDSWGLSQINLYWNSNVTKAQAQDADFSLQFMAKAFSKSKQTLWSCWKILKLGDNGT